MDRCNGMNVINGWLTERVGDAADTPVIPVKGAGRRERFLDVTRPAEKRWQSPDERVDDGSQNADATEAWSKPGF